MAKLSRSEVQVKLAKSQSQSQQSAVLLTSAVTTGHMEAPGRATWQSFLAFLGVDLDQ
jgi:hypothetical protein